MKKQISLVLAVLMLLSSVFVIDISALASDGKCINVKINVTENYDYSNEVLSLVNKERAQNGKSALQMDEGLLESAMVRAAEIVTYYSHTRPNGEDCFSINPMMYGENIAIGQVDPQAVMNAWMNSQGHRENILRDGYASIGIGCVEYKSRFYWVQVFGYDYAKTPVIKSGTTSTIRSIEILLENIELKNSTDYIASYEKYPNGYAANILAVNCGWSYVNYDFDLSLLDFKSSDPGIFTVDSNGWINLKKSGQATLTAVLKADESISVSREIYVSVDLEAPTAKYVVNSDRTFTIFWNSVEGADQYEVYFSNDGGKTYNLTRTTPNTSVTTGTAAFDKVFKYQIRAVNNTYNIKSAGSNIVDAVNDKYLSTPTAAFAVNTDCTFTISWNKVTGADKYEVYYSGDGGNTYKLKTTTTALSCKTGTAAFGATYKYKVRAVNSANNVKSAYSAVVNAVNNKYLPAPTTTYAVNSDRTFTISWNKVTGADKYEIYSYNASTGTYKYVKTTTELSHKTGKAAFGTTYKYKIRAVNSADNIKSGYCTVSAVNNKYLPAPSAKFAVNSDCTLTISWAKVTGADKYEIYSYNASTGTYKYVKTTTALSHKTGAAAFGTTYKYKIRAVNSANNVKSAYCTMSAVNNKKLTTPTAKVTVNTNGTFTISWGKVTGATKYEVYIFDSKLNDYRLSRTSTGTSITTGTASKGVTYKYKVRAITSKDTSATSDFSAVVTGKG